MGTVGHSTGRLDGQKKRSIGKLRRRFIDVRQMTGMPDPDNE
ncbi:MAG: hypothetical protein ACYCSR_12845 [Thiomonas sp.]